ncbi:hypothetical protein EV421DRAFT_1808788 [Armillaria borealis]|uniref:Uncharacterized protein n=1 Tax=Armillaria borealis TaxID=47425 RepID=A0AA39JGK3_9AGAR|nr:hypothetical protein EV421DRAFT_1808788 [Armillaria borealis]
MSTGRASLMPLAFFSAGFPLYAASSRRDELLLYNTHRKLAQRHTHTLPVVYTRQPLFPSTPISNLRPSLVIPRPRFLMFRHPHKISRSPGSSHVNFISSRSMRFSIHAFHATDILPCLGYSGYRDSTRRSMVAVWTRL